MNLDPRLSTRATIFAGLLLLLAGGCGRNAPVAVQEKAIADLIAQHNDDQALAVLGKSIQTQEKSDAMSLVRFTIDGLLNAGRPEIVERVLTQAATVKASPDEIKHLILATHVRVSAACGDWAALSTNFPAAVNTLADGELDALLRAIVPIAARTGKQAVIDQCAELILFSPMAASKPATVATAASTWTENTMKADKNKFPSRLANMRIRLDR